MGINTNVFAFANFLGRIVPCSAAPILAPDANGLIFRYDGSAAINVSVPAALPLGYNVGFIMNGTGSITLVPVGGVTNRSAKTALTIQYSSGSILVSKLNEFLTGGDFA